MKLESLLYTDKAGWSVHPFPALDSTKTLIFVFGAPEFMDHHEPIDQLVRSFPHSHIVGCSTAGEIWGTQLYDHSLAVTIVQFEKTEVDVAAAPVRKTQDSFSAGRFLADQLNRSDLSAVLIFSEGSQVNGTELVNGFNLPAHIAITGGLAGDGDQFQRTWVLHHGKPTADIAVAVGLYGQELTVGYGSRSGWESTSTEWTVTRAEGSILYELDGRPALAVYKQALGDALSELPAGGLRFPLALRADLSDPMPIIRTLLRIDEATQSMFFAGDIPEGYLAQLMTANLDQLISSAALTTLGATNHLQATAQTLCLAISCIGRRLVLKARTHEELEAVFKTLPSQTHLVGFYSYGEISPSEGFCDLHNQTMTVTLLQEN